MTVHQQIAEPLRRLGVTCDHDARVRESLDRVGLRAEFLPRRRNELSGGQAQRVGIARAILKDAPIVLLDEATAVIDPTNERELQTALARLVAGRTLIVVAHKLSTIQAADQILVLDGGRIVERGRHEDLLGQKGLYSRLWAHRAKAAGWRIGQ